jgi:hypothetical protein
MFIGLRAKYLLFLSDFTKLIVAFRNVAGAPKNDCVPLTHSTLLSWYCVIPLCTAYFRCRVISRASDDLQNIMKNSE